MSLGSCFSLESQEGNISHSIPDRHCGTVPLPYRVQSLTRSAAGAPAAARSWERVLAGTKHKCPLVLWARAAPWVYPGSCAGLQRSRCSNAPQHRTTAQSCIEPASGLGLELLRWGGGKGEWVGKKRTGIFLCCGRVLCASSGLCCLSSCSAARALRAPVLLSPSWTPLRKLQLYPVLRPDTLVGSPACYDSSLVAFYYCS